MAQDIEEIAVSAVKQRLAYTGYIETGIRSKDKEPLWDGNIYVYSSKNRDTKGLVRNIICQCKGCTTKNINSSTISYSITKQDLKNYLDNGGVVYFVVVEDEDNRKEKIYYNALLPVVLQQYIQELDKNGNNSKSIKLKELPDKDEDIVDMLINFYDNQKKQHSFVNVPLIPFNEALINDNTELLIPYSSIKQDLNIFKEIQNKDLFVYTKPQKDGEIPKPILGMAMIVNNFHNKQSPVKVAGKEYYKSFSVIEEFDKLKITIGKNFELIVLKDKGMQLNLSCKGTLRERIHDLEFIQKLLETNEIEIDNSTIPLFPENNEELSASIEKRMNETKLFLEQYRNYLRALQMINLDVDLDMDKFTERDYWNCDLLVRVVLNHEKIEDLNPKCVPTANLNIGEYKIKLFCGGPDDENKYFVAEATTSDIRIVEKETQKHTSKYAYLITKDFIEISNLDPIEVCKDIKSFETSEVHIGVANQTLLKMLLAYDVKPNERLKSAILELNNYLLDIDKSSDITLINDAQIKVRFGSLRDEDRKQIRQIQKISDNLDIKFGCAVVLKNIDSAEELLEQFEENELKQIKEMPIYKLFEKEKNNG